MKLHESNQVSKNFGDVDYYAFSIFIKFINLRVLEFERTESYKMLYVYYSKFDNNHFFDVTSALLSERIFKILEHSCLAIISV